MSHRARTTESPTMLPQTTKTSRSSTERVSSVPQRLSMNSNSSTGRRSSTSLEGPPSSRPSGIPRPTKTSSINRPNPGVPSRVAPIYPTQLKVSSNVVGTVPKPSRRSRATDRITPTDSTPRIVTDDDLISLEPSIPMMDMDHDTVFGIAIPQKPLPRTTNLPPRLIPELQALAATTYRRPTPAMSTISTVSSPSTQMTTSPSPWSASTTTTTPTSWSSASPALVQPTRSQTVSKRSQTVPIPSVVRTKMPKLPALQETAASSVSPPKANIPQDAVSTPKKLRKKTPANSPAPTPPPRTSSIKRNRSRSGSKNEDLPPAISDIAPPLPREQDISPILRHVEEATNRPTPALPIHPLTDHHNKLQDAINYLPARPSRDGIEDIEIRKPYPINVNHSNYDEQIRKLLEPATIEALPQPVSKPSLQLTRKSEPDPTVSVQPTRSRLAKFSKLALFGRSPKKPSVEKDTTDQSRKLQRPGPSAGTGHEGYSRFGRKERRRSTDGNTTATDSEGSVVSTQRRPLRSMSRNNSSTSVRRDRTSQSDLDDFASSRLKPVVILGGSQKLPGGGLDAHPSQAKEIRGSADGTAKAADGQDELRHISVTSSGPLLRESRLLFHLDSLDVHDYPQQASHRSQKADIHDRSRMPPSINTDLPRERVYPSSRNTSQSSIAPASVALSERSSDLYKVDSKLLEKQRKKSRKLNWGFFRKKESAPEVYQPRTTSRNAVPQMAVRISDAQPARPQPYYAMLESDNEISHAEAMGDYLIEAARSMHVFDEDEEIISPIEEPETELRERTRSVLLPSAPQLRSPDASMQSASISADSFPSPPKQMVSSQPVTQFRRPRLAQVGRIPKVVPTTQAGAVPQPLFARPSQPDAISRGAFNETAKRPVEASPPVNRSKPPSKPIFGKQDKVIPTSVSSRTGQDQVLATTGHTRDILRILDRYSTTSSSSDGVISVMGPPLLPAPEFPTRSIRYTTTEDDVWNEYDDFIDHVVSSPRLKKSKTRITDEDKVRPLSAFKYDAPVEKALPFRKAPKGLAVDTSLALPPLLFGSPTSIGDQDTEQDFRLRRSRIVSALHSSMDPSSPFSIGDYLAELGEPRASSSRTSGRLSDSTISQNGLRSPRTLLTFPDTPLTPSEFQHYENAVHMDDLDRSKDPAGHSERSYASLMVSRWLSFGRVLFSPAHNDIQKQPERHVLVIDGLGNEDWSIYCAVTYQAEQAYIYDLKETGHTRSSTSPTKAGQAPQNFRRRELSSFNEVFKFPDNFFSVIVLRFPPVMAESKLKNIISECRRILAPGGYMELMLLDLDIVNMGVLTRRAMRNLKTKIAMRNREVSLKPVIDNIQSVLGEKGFSKLSRCVVGVPVVGKPIGTETPTSSRSSGGSDKIRRSPSAGPRPLQGLEGRRHHNFSLNDLVADHSDNADAKIGRVVSRTARSWWQHCFEAAVISDGNLSQSILADKQVLEECKSRASSFKLLIAYTQKPAHPSIGMKRRTMSEPVIATLATAGKP